MTQSRSQRVQVLTWLVGVLAGLAVGGWALKGDFLLNWDQVIGPRIPIPPGLWGLGPELPRRTPFYVPLWLLSMILGGPRAVAVVVIASVACAVAGTARLCGWGGAGLLAGLVYGLSPFLLSRAGVGHLPVVVATALLPWLMFELSERSPRSLLRWAAAFGLLGSSGALLGLIPIGLASLGRTRRHRNLGRRLRSPTTTMAWGLLSQAAWVAPGLVAIASGVPFPTSEVSSFDVKIEGLGGLPRAIVGGGLFLQGEDVALRSGVAAGLMGLVLLGLGVSGLGLRSGGLRGASRGKPVDWIKLSAGVGAGLVFLPAVPVVGGLWRAVASVGPLGIVRETQKFWPLLGLALAVGTAELLLVLRRRVAVILGCGICALMLATSWPGLFGAQGRLAGVVAPQSWFEVEDKVRSDPGRLAVFPWRRYDNISLADGRTVLQPAPWILPGSVFISADVGNKEPGLERLEPMQVTLAEADARVRAGEEIAPTMQSLGIKWLLVMNPDEAEFYRRLGKEDGVELVVRGQGVDLYRFSQSTNPMSWHGTGVPITRVTGGELWERACERGWRVGTSTVDRTKLGCQLPIGGGLLWFPPALLALMGLLTSLAFLLWPTKVTVGGRY